MKDTNEKEDELQFQEQVFGVFTNVMSDIFVMLKPDKDQPEYVSPNVERILGIPRQEAKASFCLMEYIEPEKGEINRELMREIPINGNRTFDVKRIHRETGETLWFHDTVYHINLWDEDICVVVLSDRTKEHQSHEELVTELDVTRTANDAKNTFLSNMSHDIRTPMNAIVGLTSLLEKDADNPELALSYVHRISASGQQMLELLDDVLDISKIESGKAELSLTEINLASLVDEVFTFLHPRIYAKGQRFEVITEGLLHENIMGDRSRLNQILVNIISNAIKYTHPNGRIKLQIAETEHEDKKRGRYRFTVKDNGIGMSEEFQKVIFEPFTREDSAFIKKMQGAGLGMSITKNLVEMMDGTISVQSRPGMGSSFFVDLEFEFAKDDADLDFWEKSGISKILVADKAETREKVKAGMTGTHVVLSEAETAAETIAAVRQAHEEGNDFDLILIERSIADELTDEDADGENEDVVSGIRRMLPPDSVILLSNAYDRTESYPETQKAGINGALSKPFFMANFRKTVDRVLNEEGAMAEEKKESVLKGRNILIAEDNELNADILAELVELRGATYQLAENGRAALRLFEKAKPGEFDAIFMDIQMPVMDGYEATKAIRRCANPDGRTVPIIAMTAKAFTEDVRDSLEAGMDAYVAKPIDMKMLELTLKEVWEL